MRKISLAVSLVALLAASPAFADPNNSSIIDQVNNVTDSTVGVTQTGFAGHQNKSKVWQDGTAKSHATVNQINTGQTNDSNIEQSGRRSTAIVNQNIESLGASGGGNTSTIKQHGTGYFSFNQNMASVSQEGDVVSNTSDIDQIGKKLTATVNQRGTENTNSSTVKQWAEGSTVIVNQGSDVGSDNMNESLVDQFADDSTINVTQAATSVGLHHYSKVYQDGSDNTVTVVQN